MTLRSHLFLYPTFQMKTSYTITGMSCQSCVAKVKTSLEELPEVNKVDVSKEEQSLLVDSDKMVPATILQNALKAYGDKYKVSKELVTTDITEAQKSWLETYKPILLLFFFITLVSLLAQVNTTSFDFKVWMRHFMAGFFLAFSFFKLLDLAAFAQSYQTYDIIAKKWYHWGYVYAFIELGLGVAFLLGVAPLITNIIAFTVMTVSIIGVLQAVSQKQKIQCACLGTVFDLPMSTVTIIEDALMILMSGAMISFLL